MPALDNVADAQANWSTTANRLKSSTVIARNTAFGLSIGGALLTAIASQLQDGNTRLGFAVAGAILLGCVSFLSMRLLNAERIGQWTRARSAAEALKREAFKFAASASPYADPATRDQLLRGEQAQIEGDVDDLLHVQRKAETPGSCPRTTFSRQEYIDKRVMGQARGFYEPKAEEFRKRAARLRVAEFVFSLCAAVITAVVGVASKYPFGIAFDATALTAVLTTVAGLILAHIEASRYDALVTTYRAAARRLRNEEQSVGAVNSLTQEDCVRLRPALRNDPLGREQRLDRQVGQTADLRSRPLARTVRNRSKGTDP